jgi:hypothetical protein
MKKLASLLCLTILVTACGSGTNSPSGGNTDVIKGNFSKFGFITLGESSLSQAGIITTSVYGGGVFVTLPEVQTEVPKNPFAAVIDTCFVITDNTTDPLFPIDDPTENATFLNAGDALTVKNGAQTLLTLEKITSTNMISYDKSEEGKTLPSQGVTLDIPGADFPAFSNLAFGSIAPLTITSPSDVNNVTLDTTFTWNAGNSSDLFLFYVSQDSPYALAACYAKDDGSFTFPDKTKTELSAAQFSKGSFFQAQRISARVETKDDAYLWLLTTTGVPLIVPPQPTIR